MISSFLSLTLNSLLIILISFPLVLHCENRDVTTIKRLVEKAKTNNLSWRDQENLNVIVMNHQTIGDEDLRYVIPVLRATPLFNLCKHRALPEYLIRDFQDKLKTHSQTILNHQKHLSDEFIVEMKLKGFFDA